MADKAMKASLAEIINTIGANGMVITAVQNDNKMVLELLHNIYQRVEDMSKKFDEVLNTGIKKPKSVPKNTPVKKPPAKKKSESKSKTVKETSSTEGGVKLIKNIMTYFKTRFTENDKFFNDILEENQAESIFAEHEDEINSKKAGAARTKAQATILYKNLTKDQKKKIREKMMDEHDKASINDEDDIEDESGTHSDSD